VKIFFSTSGSSFYSLLVLGFCENFEISFVCKTLKISWKNVKIGLKLWVEAKFQLIKINRKLRVATEIGSTFFLDFNKLPGS
jgi:hypothetical protein